MPMKMELIYDFAATNIVYFARAQTGRRFEIWRRLFDRSEYVDRGYETPCFEWMGRDCGKGKYGRMNLNDCNVPPHKASWTNVNGIIPYNKQLDHLCCNTKCWRDDHLELVTNKRNQKRRAQRAKARKVAADV